MRKSKCAKGEQTVRERGGKEEKDEQWQADCFEAVLALLPARTTKR